MKTKTSLFENIFWLIFIVLVGVFLVHELLVQNDVVYESSMVYRTMVEICGVMYLAFRLRWSKTSVLAKITILWALWTAFVIVLGGDREIASHQIRDVLRALLYMMLWPIVMLVVYTFAKNNPHRKNLIVGSFLVLFFIISYEYYTTYQEVGYTLSGFEIQVTSIYFITIFTPWILLLKNQILTITLFGIVGYLNIVSLKRGSILVFGGALLLYLIWRLSKRWKWILYAVGCGLFAWYYSGTREVIIEKVEYITDRFESINSDEGSGRLTLYAECIDGLKKSSVVEWVFGHGYGGTERLMNISAHDDYLDVVYNYGLIGLFLLLSILFFLIKRCYLEYKRGSFEFLSLGVCCFMFIVLTLISHLMVYSHYNIILFAFIGLMEARNNDVNTNLAKAKDGL